LLRRKRLASCSAAAHRKIILFLKGLEESPRLPPRAPRESPDAVREPSRGFTRL